MLKNLLKISLRNLLRHRVNSLITISGLSIGMACCILVGFYVRHELSYDRFHTKADRIHRLVYPTEPRQLAPLAPCPSLSPNWNGGMRRQRCPQPASATPTSG